MKFNWIIYSFKLSKEEKKIKIELFSCSFFSMMFWWIWIFKTSSKNYIPKLWTYSKSCLLSTKMMLIMISLKSMEIWPFIFLSIYVMKGIMSTIIHQVSGKYTHLKEDSNSIIIRLQRLENKQLQKRISNREQNWWINKSIRIVRQHMMNSMQRIMQVSDNPVIGQPFFTMENKPMKNILKKWEGEYSQQEGQ